MSFDVEKIRKDFPILSKKINNNQLVYFDNAATTQKPIQVIEAIEKYSKISNSNIHRGVHFLSQESTNKFEETRKIVQNFINAKSSEQIIFTKGTTESINLVVSSFGKKFIKEGDEIIITEMEHHSNIVPWQVMCKEKKATLKVIPVNDNGELLKGSLEHFINNKTKLIALTHVSNALGTINPIKTLIKMSHWLNVPVLIDGTQASSHLKIDVQSLNCDFYCFSGHKMYGPTGIGVLYGKKNG